MSTELIKVTINEQELEVEKGARLIDVCRENGFAIPSFCYYQDLALQASCPNVSGPHRKDAQAPDVLYHYLHRRNGRDHRQRRSRKGSTLDGRIPACKPSTRLPCM
ncbi:MAG: (2Fe-2S)-binding protein [Chloracidobacterium sp.]|nr:(2Fe-2S)-binding protein [Chloracidobacterium sp.]